MVSAMLTMESVAATMRSNYDWSPVMDAIIKVESNGNPRAVNGKHAGVLQISPILVRECNNILKRRGSKKRYTLNDRFCPKKSREMFVLIQSEHNPENNVSHAIRMWNGGTGYSVRGTNGYYRRVKKHL